MKGIRHRTNDYAIKIWRANGNMYLEHIFIDLEVMIPQHSIKKVLHKINKTSWCDITREDLIAIEKIMRDKRIQTSNRKNYEY
jgi:hypothetical protein